MLVILAFAPAKLLAFYEVDTVKLAVGDWILMIWCIFASLAVQGQATTTSDKARQLANHLLTRTNIKNMTSDKVALHSARNLILVMRHLATWADNERRCATLGQLHLLNT
ncbi:hypothetical protein ANCDUO_20276 [Ancylostoma duodenale]|uniref:Uncharacterized protein n=1 Tax=Ancylostoma duodenale TaxID=51022 RepID=A0A0C2C086_9BILA|nr:hypothetical protein ANCDUO_20276 [Ancylostoma duodenale]